MSLACAASRKMRTSSSPSRAEDPRGDLGDHVLVGSGGRLLDVDRVGGRERLLAVTLGERVLEAPTDHAGRVRARIRPVDVYVQGRPWRVVVRDVERGVQLVHGVRPELVGVDVAVGNLCPRRVVHDDGRQPGDVEVVLDGPDCLRLDLTVFVVCRKHRLLAEQISR